MSVRTFGRYEVLARLATGGTANIFLARQPGAAGFHKLVCLKTLLPARASDQDFVAMFLDEARLAACLSHPNCVQIYDLGRARGVYYISMEYILGETLWNLLTTVRKFRTPLPPGDVAAIVAAACEGLHHAHELRDPEGRSYNLVHRDVSPQNIMVSFDGHTKVLDFGIAKAETGRVPTTAGIVKGKFAYMSPEQIAGGELDRRSDIFSLGIVLFECLSSRRLFRGDSPEEIARLILEQRAPRLSEVVGDIPSPLEAICARALEPRPGHRFQTALDMRDALRAYLDDARYPGGTAPIARLCEERFGESVPRRRRAVEAALQPRERLDHGGLLEALGAGRVRELDLTPPEEECASAPDFMEHAPRSSGEGVSPKVDLGAPTAAELTPRRPLAPEVSADPARPVAASGPEAAWLRAVSTRFRVELEEATEEPARIEMVSARGAPPDDLESDAPTLMLAEMEANEAPGGSAAWSEGWVSSGIAPSGGMGAIGEPLERPSGIALRRVVGTPATGPEPPTGPVSPPLGFSPAPSLPRAPAESMSPPVGPLVGAPQLWGPLEAALRVRFGIAAMLAALAFGLALGLVAGMLLTRAMFVVPVPPSEPSRSSVGN